MSPKIKMSSKIFNYFQNEEVKIITTQKRKTTSKIKMTEKIKAIPKRKMTPKKRR